MTPKDFSNSTAPFATIAFDEREAEEEAARLA
jgi:hypothetical protein